ncbi:NECAP-1, N-terminal [Phytophthora cactorum]|nr:NECAP-1, N-terminal [Phytophthora cactorum]
MAEVEVQRVLATINQVFVFQIPPQTSAAGHRADSWPSTPAWTGRLQVSSVGEDAVIELKDPNTGALFAACPIKAGGPSAIQKVVDSSRYFVLRAVDRVSAPYTVNSFLPGRHAFIGIAFNNRSDAFDFNVAIDDFNKELKREKTQQESTTTAPPVDYSLKEGQTIRIKLNTKKKDSAKAEEDDDMDPFESTSSPKKTSSSLLEIDPTVGSLGDLEVDIESENSNGGQRSKPQDVEPTSLGQDRPICLGISSYCVSSKSRFGRNAAAPQRTSPRLRAVPGRRVLGGTVQCYEQRRGVAGRVHERAGPDLDRAVVNLNLRNYAKVGDVMCTVGCDSGMRRLVHCVGQREQRRPVCCCGFHFNGAVRFPVPRAADIALSAIRDLIRLRPRWNARVAFVCIDDDVYEQFQRAHRETFQAFHTTGFAYPSLVETLSMAEPRTGPES